MAIIPVQKHKHRDGASNPDTSSPGDTEDTVKKKKRKMIDLDAMYMGSGDAEGTPKRQKRKVDSENQDVESDPIIPSKKSGDGYIDKATDQETYKKKKKKRKDESHQDDASSSIVLHQECNEKIKKAHKAKNSDRLHGNTDLEGESKERKKKKTKKDCGERLLDDSLVEDLSAVQTHHTNKRKKRKDGGDLQCEEVDESVDQSERAVKKKKRKEESHQEADDASHILPMIKKKKKRKDGGDLQCEEGDESVDRSERAVKKKKRKEESHQEAEDTAADDASYILPMSKKKKKKKDGGDLQSDGFTEDVDEIVDQSERTVKKKKKKRKEESHQEADDASYILSMSKKKKKWKDGGDLQDDGFAERLPSHRKSPDGSDAPEQVDECLDQVEKPIKKKKKRKDESDQEVKDIEIDDGAPSVVLYREQNEKIKKSHKKKDTKDCKETSEQVDQSETAVKKKKKKRKDEPHQETDDIAEDDGASSIVYQEKNKTTKKSHKAKDTKRRHGDEGLPEEALYEEPADITDEQSLKKKKKDRRLEEELLTSETQHTKKKKKQKMSGDLQDGGFTETLPSHRKSPGGSDAPEQVDECLDQVEKPIKKKKKKRKDETHQEAEDRAVDDGASSIGLHEDEPSYSEPNDTEDRPNQRKKKKSKKVHSERPLEDRSVDELLDHDAQRTNKKKTKLKGGRDESHGQHGYTETTEQGVETEDQTEVQVKKKAKHKKHLDRSEETCEISETQPEGGQSLQSRVVESDGNVKDTEQTPTGGQSRPQTSTSTDTDQNPATQDNNSPATSGKSTQEPKRKQQSKKPFIRKQDLELIKEFFPLVKEEDIQMKFILSQELERIKFAKRKGIMFRSGQFTIEEDEQIKKNVEKFMAEVGIDSPVMLFHPYYFPEQLKTINALRRKFRFSQRIADGLFRSCDQAVVRGSYLYRFATSTGRFSEQEVKELKKCHEEHGDDYIAISKIMSRTVMSAQRKINDMNYEVNRGPWSVEETNLLISAVKELVLDSLRKENKSGEEPVTVPKRKLYKGLKWVQIEKKVVTRNWTHCKARWSNVISTRMNNGVHPCKGDHGRLTNMKIIQWMRDAGVRDFGDVKWDKLCDDIGNVTSFSAQLNFVALKQSVEDWKNKRLYEIVDYLCEVTLPRLEYQLSSVALEEPEKKDEFLISEMFREYTEYE